MILNIENITYRLNDLEILKNVSLKINRGDCISLVGQSGSGKSTLFKIIADLLPMTDGKIYFNGKSYNDYEPIELRRKISYCIQIPYLFGDKVYENFEFPFKIRKEEVNKKIIEELLPKVNLDESILNKSINGLSGGEKQRISIIRTLLYTPDIILLDEATSALDLENAQIVEKYIKELNYKGVTVLWITHDIAQSKGIFNKRITMEQGKIIEVEIIK